MLSFQRFYLKEVAVKKNFFTKNGMAVLTRPIHFRHVNRPLNEDKDFEFKHNYDGKDGVYRNPQHLATTKQLKRNQKSANGDTQRSVERYEDSSKTLNQTLVNAHKEGKPVPPGKMIVKDRTEDEVADNIPAERYGFHKHYNNLQKISSQPIGMNLRVHSGMSFDPSEAIKKGKGILHMPAFTSVTHDENIAHSFARPVVKGDTDHVKLNTPTSWENNKPKFPPRDTHIMHIDMQPHDKGYHISEKEHETILPANTQLKHIDSHRDYNNPDVMHHNFTIHHQE